MEISGPPLASELVLVQLTTLASLMLDRAGALTDIILAKVYQEFPVYSRMIEPERLRATIHAGDGRLGYREEMSIQIRSAGG